jgi:hypothetical protein
MCTHAYTHGPYFLMLHVQQYWYSNIFAVMVVQLFPLPTNEKSSKETPLEKDKPCQKPGGAAVMHTCSTEIATSVCMRPSAEEGSSRQVHGAKPTLPPSPGPLEFRRANRGD